MAFFAKHTHTQAHNMCVFVRVAHYQPWGAIVVERGLIYKCIPSLKFRFSFENIVALCVLNEKMRVIIKI